MALDRGTRRDRRGPGPGREDDGADRAVEAAALLATARSCRSVTVYSVSGCQCAIGAIVSCRPAGSHVTLIALSGDTRRAPATDAASIGESNLTWMGALTACPVRTASSSSAVTGVGAEAGTAALGAGGRLAMATRADHRRGPEGREQPVGAAASAQGRDIEGDDHGHGEHGRADLPQYLSSV